MEDSTGRQTSGRDSRWSRLFLLGAASLLSLMLGEGLLAFFLPPPIAWRTPQERYDNHPTRLHVLRPNQKAFTHDKPLRINALGLRGDEVEISKPPGRFRIVVMGDSITFGNGVRDDETYSVQLGRKLHEAGFRGAEVINAGIPGYDTWQEALLLEEVVLSLSPDLILLAFYENDVSQRPKTVRPLIGERGESPRTGLAARLGDRWIFLLKRSRLLVLAWEAYQRARVRWLPSPAARVRIALLNGDHYPPTEAAWGEVETSLRHMAALLKREGVPLATVVFPMPEQVWNTGASTAAYQGRLQEITRQIRVPTLDLLPAFRKAAAEGRHLYIYWDWHPAPEGHRAAAEAIDNFIHPIVARGMARP